MGSEEKERKSLLASGGYCRQSNDATAFGNAKRIGWTAMPSQNHVTEPEHKRRHLLPKEVCDKLVDLGRKNCCAPTCGVRGGTGLQKEE